jgi:aldehyde dehydrogenase (NAD+)
MTLSTNNSSLDLSLVFNNLKSNARNVSRTNAAERVAKLKKLENYLREPKHIKALEEALYADFKKHPVEVMSSEISAIIQQITHVKKNLSRWMTDKMVDTPLTLVGTKSWIRYESKGVCLILSPWNYPFNLSILPLIYAIAAGNTVLLKPSELAPHTATFINNLLSDLYQKDEIAVLEGDASLAGKLLSLPFNHIYFTGSPQIGKIVMAAAAQHLSSVTLELGGKSPAIIEKSAPIEASAEKCVWAKHFNNGQTCIAPDYLLVQENVADAFVTAYQKSISKLYNAENKGIINSPDYCRIINTKHFNRIKDLFDDAVAKGAKVLAGGEFDEKELFISPTLLGNVSDDMKIMEEEIFGPVMPMMTFKNTEEVIETIYAKPKPLSLYVASKNNSFIHEIISRTSSGGTVINDYLLGYLNPELPFGGVNNSGLGKAMGFHSFVDFSNERGIVKRTFGTLSFIYPPYNGFKQKLVSFLAFKLS